MSTSKPERAVIVARLRKDLEHAAKMARLYPGRGWVKTLARINRQIMTILAQPRATYQFPPKRAGA